MSANGQSQPQSLFYQALEAKYEAEVKEAVATLNVYFQNAVGIGEHPQHVEEMDKQMERLSNAQDKLENLRRFFNGSGQVKEANITRLIATESTAR